MNEQERLFEGCGLMTAVFSVPKDPKMFQPVTFEDRDLSLQLEGELAYGYGDFEWALQCFRAVKSDSSVKINACAMAMICALSLGKYEIFEENEVYLNKKANEKECTEEKVLAQTALLNAYFGMLAPQMASDWMKQSDFSRLPDNLRPLAGYLQIKYFQGIKEYEKMLGAALNLTTYLERKDTFTLLDVYLNVMCGVANMMLQREEEGEKWLRKAMKLGLPYGFITPFAENLSCFFGNMEKVLEQEYPQYLKKITAQWEQTIKCWIQFHNRFTKDHITQLLTRREYQIAQQIAVKTPYSEVAKKQHLSEGRVKNIMQEVYQKLYISSRKELVEYVLWR